MVVFTISSQYFSIQSNCLDELYLAGSGTIHDGQDFSSSTAHEECIVNISYLLKTSYTNGNQHTSLLHLPIGTTVL